MAYAGSGGFRAERVRQGQGSGRSWHWKTSVRASEGMVEFCVDVDPHTQNKVKILRLNFGRSHDTAYVNVQYYAVILTSQAYHVYLHF